MKHSVEEKEEKIIPDKPTTNHGQSTVINTILSRIFPSRVKVIICYHYKGVAIVMFTGRKCEAGDKR